MKSADKLRAPRPVLSYFWKFHILIYWWLEFDFLHPEIAVAKIQINIFSSYSKLIVLSGQDLILHCKIGKETWNANMCWQTAPGRIGDNFIGSIFWSFLGWNMIFCTV